MGSFAYTMKTNTVANGSAETNKSETKFLGPCVVAALVWLMLALYIYYVIPLQLDVRDQTLKPEVMRAVLPAPLKAALFFHESSGTALVSVLGFVGCGIAYVRRNSKLANWMIGLGTLCLAALVWAVVSNIVKR